MQSIRCAGPGCTNPIPPSPTNDPRKRFCRPRCRQRAHREEVRQGKVAIPHRRPPEPEHGARVLPAAIDRPAQFCYCDPPYPGRAYLYPENTEVDHGDMIGALVEQFPDGWALSTGANNLRDVLALCPPGVRVASWHHQHRPYVEQAHGWEPVILCGGRRRPDVNVVDTLVARAPSTWALPGQKPAKFFRWVARMLGARSGDTMAEPFPGSGAGERAFHALALRTTFPPAGTLRRRNVLDVDVSIEPAGVRP